MENIIGYRLWRRWRDGGDMLCLGRTMAVYFIFIQGRCSLID